MISALWRRSRAIWLNRQARNLILAMLMLASVAVLVWSLVGGWRDLMAHNWRLDWVPLVLSLPVYALSLGMVMFGWTIIIRTLGIESTWQQDARFFMSSWIARRLPTPGPYFVSRVMLYEGIGVPKRLTSMGLLWENITMAASGAVLMLLLLPFAPHVGDVTLEYLDPTLALVLFVIGMAISLVFVVRPMLMARAVNRLLAAVKKEPLTVVISPKAALLVLGIYALVWLLGGVILFLLIRAVNPIDWALLPLVVESWVLSGLVAHLTFFLPVGFLLRELALIPLLSLFLPLSVAVVIAVLVRFWMMLNELLWALIFSRV